MEFNSFYNAQVVNNNDPKHLGRLKVKCPDIYGSETSDWAKPRGIYNGNGYGFFAIPQKGENVIITCQYGNSDYPFWEYGEFAEKELLDEVKQSKETQIWQTPKGQKLKFLSNGLVELSQTNGAKIILNQDGKIEILNGEGSFNVQLKALLDWIKNAKTMPAATGVQLKFDPVQLTQLQDIITEFSKILNF